MMLDNASYNKVKLVYEVSKLIWFIEKHALLDAEKAGDASALNDLKVLQAQLHKSLEGLQKNMCSITQ